MQYALKKSIADRIIKHFIEILVTLL